MYVFPKFSKGDRIGIRIGGPGLGNLFFPLARAIVFANKYNSEIINPTWRNIKIGPAIRFERDKRFYFNLFNKIGISGFRKYKILLNNKMKSESDFQLSDCNYDSIIFFNGLGNYFQDIRDDYKIIKVHLIEMIKSRYLIKISNNYEYIGLHIRLGDYRLDDRIDFNWCIKIISILRDELGDLKIMLFSDGKDSELSTLMQGVKNIERVFFGNAICDLIALSRCKILIASDSTFSGWAAYLGRVPVIFQKRHFSAVYSENDGFEVVVPNPDDLLIQINKLKLCLG